MFIRVKVLWNDYLKLTLQFLFSLLFIKCLAVCALLSLVLKKEKIGPGAVKCIFVGYPSIQKGYNNFLPITLAHFLFVDVIFFNTFLYFHHRLKLLSLWWRMLVCRRSSFAYFCLGFSCSKRPVLQPSNQPSPSTPCPSSHPLPATDSF